MRAPAVLLALAVLAAGCFAAPDPDTAPAATDDKAAPPAPTGGAGTSGGSGAPPPKVVTDPPCAFDGSGCVDCAADGACDAPPRGHAVVAVVDSGINPYHVDFAAPHLPAAGERIPGFPADAAPLALTLGGTHADAVAADATAWKAIEPGRLYTIAGTRIAGAVTLGGLGTALEPSSSLILDDNGHGTGTASAVARASPNADIVVVQVGARTLADGIRWAAAQPWIDVVSVSWGTLGNVPTSFFDDVSAATREAADAGKLVVLAAGNEPTPAATGYGGPTWVVSVGGSSPDGKGETWTASKGVDVVSDFGPVVARHDSEDAEDRKYGTSFAAPTVAGALAEAWWQARATGVEVDAAKLRAAMNAVAVYWQPTDYRPNTLEIPVLAPCAQQGWGYVDPSHAPAILAVASGLEPAPSKGTVEACMSATYTMRAALWG